MNQIGRRTDIDHCGMSRVQANTRRVAKYLEIWAAILNVVIGSPIFLIREI